MCGHVGVAGIPIGAAHVKAFNELLFLDTLRGAHGTGIARVMPAGGTDLLKRPWPAPDFMEHKGYGALATASARVLLGHNRHATVGEKNVSNTHPFDFEHVLGAHNGTIPWNARSILEKKAGENFGTDSETLYAALNKVDPEDVKSVISDIWGAWSLVWYDKRDKTINFLRNEQRPMHWALTNENKCLFWASEQWMLEAVLERNNLLKDAKFLYTQTDTHYKIKVPTVPKDEINWTTRKIAGGKEPVSHYSAANYHGGSHRRWFPEVDQTGAKTSASGGTKNTRPQQTGGSVIHLSNRSSTSSDDTPDPQICLKGYNGALVTPETWDRLGPCDWESPQCLGKPEFRHVKSGVTPVRWIDSGHYVCSVCKEDKNFKQCFEGE